MISKRASELKPSPTLALASLAGQLKAEGRDVIPLSVGEPDWDTFAEAKEAGIRAIREGKTKYMPESGTLPLRKAIARQLQEDIGMSYAPDCITVSTGAKFVVFDTLQVLVDPGDEVVIPAPYWVSYPDMVKLADGVAKTVVCGLEHSFKLNGELLRGALSEKTKVLILNSPSNPTGEVYSAEELKEIAAVLKDFPRVVVLSDDIYNRLVFNGKLAPHILQVAPELQPRTVVINGVSKSYSMTGWRVGWAAGPKEVISAMNRYQSQSVSCAASISQEAALYAVENCDQQVIDSVEVLKRRMDLVYAELSALSEIKVTKPGGAFYFWPDISAYVGKSYEGQKITGSEDFSKFLLQDQNVAATAGVHFGLEGFLRISYALSEERMKEAVARIRKFLEKLV